MTAIYVDDEVRQRKLDKLIRHITPTLNALPYELALDLLRQSYIEFARKTEMLASLNTIDIQTDVVDYVLKAPDGYEIYKVRTAGKGTDTITGPSVNYWYTCNRRRFLVLSNNTLVLGDIPTRDEVGGLDIVVTVIPTENTTVIPDEIVTAYGKTIAAGALAEALTFKNKSWYDPSLSIIKSREFARGINSARNLNLMNRQDAPMTARTRRWL